MRAAIVITLEVGNAQLLKQQHAAFIVDPFGHDFQPHPFGHLHHQDHNLVGEHILLCRHHKRLINLQFVRLERLQQAQG